ncbi:hypothetical protein DPM13_12735 [Paracoccus mutanolyticus]|uniref:Uncharacterized protein n=1 Tax=Paracoccus mutanolyticus TaxID=1499308 RepID=A0ABM6WSJ4_9RHOB|nr:hypothetical protein DPM13_12735 [Paracoccus mutanolyticus]
MRLTRDIAHKTDDAPARRRGGRTVTDLTLSNRSRIFPGDGEMAWRECAMRPPASAGIRIV